MAGFDNDVVYGTNLDLRGVEPVVGQFTDAGHLMIGTGNVASPFAVIGHLSAGTGIVVTEGVGTISVSASASVPTTFTADAGSATPALNILNILSGLGVATSAAGNTVTISSTGGGLNWVEITATPTTLTPNTGHYINVGAGLATIPLPATASTAADDIMKIVGISAGGWIITQAAGQQVINGVLSSTAGVGGSTESSHQRDCVTLKYIGAGVWQVIDSIGNIGST